MSFSLKSLVHSVSHIAKKGEQGLESTGKSVEHDVTQATGAVTHTFSAGVDAAGHAFQNVATTVGKVAVTGASQVESGVTTAADTIARGASQEFDAAVRSGQHEFDNLRKTLEKALADGETKIVASAAERLIKDMSGDIAAVGKAWKKVSKNLSSDIDVIKSAALSKNITSRVEKSLDEIGKSMSSALGAFFSKSYVSFGIEFGASAALGVAGEVALGVIAGLPNITDVRGYGSVGVSLGAEAGAEGDIAIVFNLSSPADSGGASLNVVVSLEVDIGGTIVVSFNLPDFSLGGISIGLGAGEEAGITVGGGYTFIF